MVPGLMWRRDAFGVRGNGTTQTDEEGSGDRLGGVPAQGVKRGNVRWTSLDEEAKEHQELEPQVSFPHDADKARPEPGNMSD